MKRKESWGFIEITLDEYLKKHNISKNFVVRNANIQYNQLLSYCRNEVQRPDLYVLARICTVLKCEIGDLLKFVPNEEEQS